MMDVNDPGKPPAADPNPNPARQQSEEAQARADERPATTGEWLALGRTRILDNAAPETELVATSSTTAGRPPANRSSSGRLAGYRLVRKLGHGAMAAVYKAYEDETGRRVALKVLFKHVADNPKLLERFYREARILGRLEHPNIVQGYAVGEDRGLHYFAMEYVKGDSLQKWLTRLGQLPVADAVAVALACARALQYAHSLDLIHRDVKPDNVLVTRTGVVKVADLGMAKLADEDLSLTQTGHAVGTPWYMPLEQARNAKDADGRCDIYALGCMLYHMLVGRPPFTGPTLVDLIREKQAGTFAPARQHNPAVPERLDLVIAKMTARQPRHRHANCAELIQDLEALNLAGPTLSFLQDRPELTSHPPAEGPDSSILTPIPEAQSEREFWHVRYKGADGRPVQKRLDTDSIRRLVAQGQLGLSARASRQPNDGYRALATYREFEQTVLAHAVRSGADRQAARFRSLFKKIEAQERSRGAPNEEFPSHRSGNLRLWLALAFKVGLPLSLVAIVIWLVRLMVQAIQ